MKEHTIANVSLIYRKPIASFPFLLPFLNLIHREFSKRDQENFYVISNEFTFFFQATSSIFFPINICLFFSLPIS